MKKMELMLKPFLTQSYIIEVFLFELVNSNQLDLMIILFLYC
jgi:hypothetical protein